MAKEPEAEINDGQEGKTRKKKPERVVELKIDRIDPNPDQPRKVKNEDAIKSLAASIKEKGVIQPILVRPKGDRFEIIAGERRWLATQKAGLANIPVIIREYSKSEVLEIALIENIQREDLNPMEKAEAYQKLVDTFDYTQEKLAKKMGKSRSAVANTIRLLELDDRIQGDVRQGILTEGLARTLLTIEGEQRNAMWMRIRRGGISVRQAEMMAKRLAKKLKPAAEKEQKGRGKNLKFIEENLQELLGTKVRINQGDKKGTIEIEYMGENDLIRLLDIILKKRLPG